MSKIEENIPKPQKKEKSIKVSPQNTTPANDTVKEAKIENIKADNKPSKTVESGKLDTSSLLKKKDKRNE